MHALQNKKSTIVMHAPCIRKKTNFLLPAISFYTCTCKVDWKFALFMYLSSSDSVRALAWCTRVKKL